MFLEAMIVSNAKIAPQFIVNGEAAFDATVPALAAFVIRHHTAPSVAA